MVANKIWTSPSSMLVFLIVHCQNAGLGGQMGSLGWKGCTNHTLMKCPVSAWVCLKRSGTLPLGPSWWIGCSMTIWNIYPHIWKSNGHVLNFVLTSSGITLIMQTCKEGNSTMRMWGANMQGWFQNYMCPFSSTLCVFFYIVNLQFVPLLFPVLNVQLSSHIINQYYVALDIGHVVCLFKHHILCHVSCFLSFSLSSVCYIPLYSIMYQYSSLSWFSLPLYYFLCPIL